ncbi:MAG TPA: CaiB/BaiF CoA-transferase family protein, partial [Paraburkholderia sp.]|nr:CaiB/BaiF CoA-transferase family protein [Paraburkholderia sp.]
AGCSIADIAAGMYAYSNILSALLLRGRTGRGCRIDVSMLESMVEWMGYPLYYAMDDQQPPALSGAAHATIYPYGPFPAGDGKTVMLGLQNEREWKLFCEQVLVQPDLATDERFASNSKRTSAREALREVIVAAFAELTAAQVIERLDHAGIANAQMNTLSDVWAHPQLKARERWREIGTSAGAVPALLPPGLPTDFDPRMDPVPALGEQSDAILRELGYDNARIDALRKAGTI